VSLVLPDTDATVALGRRLAGLLRAGDLVVLTGGLGAGKTTLTRGLGEGLDVRGAVTSPTFVIARVHPPLGDGPELVHVDAYRLGGAAELDGLDLDADLDEAVTVVEWGAGLAEGLAEDRLELTLAADPATESRRLDVRAVGPRWAGIDVESLLRDEGADA
jgi:tRNA threonylcarbamoyladenosine biosynthesis protein TsaE